MYLADARGRDAQGRSGGQQGGLIDSGWLTLVVGGSRDAQGHSRGADASAALVVDLGERKQGDSPEEDDKGDGDEDGPAHKRVLVAEIILDEHVDRRGADLARTGRGRRGRMVG